MNASANGMLGILNRAGLLAFGYDALPKMRKASLLLLASDAASASLSKVLSAARQHGVQTLVVGTKEELGAPLGYPVLSAVAVLSKKGAASLLEKLQKGESHEEKQLSAEEE